MKELAAKGKSLIATIYDFWNTYGSDFQSGAVVLSALAACLVIISHRQNAKRRNTLDLIFHHESDKDLIAARRAFNKLKAGETKLVTFAGNDKRGDENFENIKKVLNIHELTAVAIEEGVIDERVFRRWFNSTVIQDYEATSAFIIAARETYKSPNGFCEFERLAKRWRDDAAWKPTPSWIGRKGAAIARVVSA